MLSQRATSWRLRSTSKRFSTSSLSRSKSQSWNPVLSSLTNLKLNWFNLAAIKLTSSNFFDSRTFCNLKSQAIWSKSIWNQLNSQNTSWRDAPKYCWRCKSSWQTKCTILAFIKTQTSQLCPCLSPDCLELSRSDSLRSILTLVSSRIKSSKEQVELLEVQQQLQELV